MARQERALRVVGGVEPLLADCDDDGQEYSGDDKEAEPAAETLVANAAAPRRTRSDAQRDGAGLRALLGPLHTEAAANCARSPLSPRRPPPTPVALEVLHWEYGQEFVSEETMLMVDWCTVDGRMIFLSTCQSIGARRNDLAFFLRLIDLLFWVAQVEFRILQHFSARAQLSHIQDNTMIMTTTISHTIAPDVWCAHHIVLDSFSSCFACLTIQIHRNVGDHVLRTRKLVVSGPRTPRSSLCRWHVGIAFSQGSLPHS